MEAGLNGALGPTALLAVAKALNLELEHAPPQLHQDQEQIVLENQHRLKHAKRLLALVRNSSNITATGRTDNFCFFIGITIYIFYILKGPIASQCRIPQRSGEVKIHGLWIHALTHLLT